MDDRLWNQEKDNLIKDKHEALNRNLIVILNKYQKKNYR